MRNFSETCSNEPLEEAVRMYEFFDRLPEKLRLFLKTANYQWDPVELLVAVSAGTPVEKLLDYISEQEKEIAEDVYRSLRT